MSKKTVTAKLDGSGLRLVAGADSGHQIVMDTAEGGTGPRRKRPRR